MNARKMFESFWAIIGRINRNQISKQLNDPHVLVPVLLTGGLLIREFSKSNMEFKTMDGNRFKNLNDARPDDYDKK